MTSEPTPRLREVFLELFEGLPRQGPGHRARSAGACSVARLAANASLARPRLRCWRADAPPRRAAAACRDHRQLAGHFTLPDEAWWDDFYTPLERRIGELRCKHAGDAEALGVLAQLAREPEMHRRHSGCYTDEFFVAQRPA